MKLLIRKKLLLQKKNSPPFRILLFSVFLFLAHAGYSQHFQFIFDNTPVSQALLEVAKKANIRISFDDSSMEQFYISKTIKTESVANVLSSIIENTGYVSEFKHSTWLIYRPLVKSNENTLHKHVSGIIYDHKTGERLPYATVVNVDNNKNIPATVDGTFSIEIKIKESTRIQILYMGYQTIDTVILLERSNTMLQFGMKQKLQNIATVNVKGNNLELLDIRKDAGHFSLNPHRFSDLPNYGESDVFRALQLLPGISAHENSSQLNIRGSSADQNLVIFDGFTLYNLDHFFGVFSAINPNVIKDIQVYRGGFDSRYGERVSGIVDITGKSGNKSKPEIYGGINLISANLTTEIPLSKKLTLVAAARRSYTDAYSSWLADDILTDKIGKTPRFPEADNVIKPEFYFGDFNTKLTWSPNQKENISLSIYGAKDELNSSNLLERESLMVTTEDYNNWGNYGLGLTWKKQQGPKYFTKLQLGHSGYFNNYENTTSFQSANDEGTPENAPNNRETKEENDLIDYFINFQNTYFLNKNNQLEFGLSLKYNEFKFSKEAEHDFVYNRLNHSGILHTAYLLDQITLSDKLNLKPGFRVNYYNQTQKVYFEPRLLANYKLTDGLQLKLATGKYYQFLNKSTTEQSYGYNRDFWILADGKIHPVVSSNHYIIGASYETRKLFFDVEAYYKTVNGLQSYLFYQNPDERRTMPIPNLPPEEQESSTFVSGTGKAYGIDFLLKYEYTNFTSWLAYSLSKSTRSFNKINNGANIPAEFDQTHEVKWTNIYAFKNWSFSTLALYTTGHPYIESTVKDDDFNTIRTYNRLPDYFRVDLSVNYNFNIKNVNIKPGFSILNAFNTENYLDIYVRDFNIQDNEFSETTLVKAQDLTFNFFVNFRF